MVRATKIMPNVIARWIRISSVRFLPLPAYLEGFFREKHTSVIFLQQAVYFRTSRHKSLFINALFIDSQIEIKWHGSCITLPTLIMRHQYTLAAPISCSGVGLHSGQPVTMTMLPAPPDTGVVFVRKTNGAQVRLGASIRNLVSTELCTAISSQGAQIKTIEHVLAALSGLGVDNVVIEIDAGEVPVLDGSSGPFVRLIRAAGVVSQKRAQPFLKITQPIEVSDGVRRVTIEPSSTPRVTYTIAYDHPLIGHQSFDFEYSASGFEREIADARTFGFLREVEALWSRGLGKGGSLDNTVVLSETGVMNQTGLRFRDEFVRHKILDLVGDLALMGMPFIGHVKADRSGHALHTKLVAEILRRPECWVMLSSDEHAAVTELPSAAHQPFLSAASVASAA